MKAALQEADEADDIKEGEGGEGSKKRIRDAKGREVLSEEERAKKEEKERQKAAEVSVFSFQLDTQTDKLRKRRCARKEYKSLLITLSGNWAFSPSRRRALMIKMSCRAGGRYPSWRLSASYNICASGV
jgi:hypothetical protein